MRSETFPPGVVEGQTLKGDLVTSCDVCIIGSGAGGAVTAARLARAGYRVIVLEHGGYFTQNRFRMREDETYTRLYQDGGQRATKDLSVTVLQGKAVGGTTVVNWTTSFRTPDPVLDHWRRRWDVRHLEPKDLAPHFDEVEGRLGIHKVPPELMNRNNRLLYDGCKALGYEVDTLKRNVRGCAQTGYCGMGCPIDAKQSMLVTFLPDAMNQGATVISRCRVERLELEGDAVRSARCRLSDALGQAYSGATLVVRASRFILSGGAIGSPALLLRSGAPDDSGMLGRRTFLHPVAPTVALYDELVEPYYGAPQSAASHHFADRGERPGFFLEAVPVHPLLASLAVPGLDGQHREHMKHLPFVAGHIGLVIDGFDDFDGGTVELDDDGNPTLDYVVPPAMWETFREVHKVLARLNLEMGATKVLSSHDPQVVMKTEADIAQLDAAPYGPCRLFIGSAHQMGGCMMSDDAGRGVVRSEDLRHHQLQNLHVIDGSVFPTSLGVNPQESIYGLASLISERLTRAWA